MNRGADFIDAHDFICQLRSYTQSRNNDASRIQRTYELLQRLGLTSAEKLVSSIDMNEIDNGSTLKDLRNFNDFLKSIQRKDKLVLTEEFADLIIMQLLKNGYAERIQACWEAGFRKGKGFILRRIATAYCRYYKSQQLSIA